MPIGLRALPGYPVRGPCQHAQTHHHLLAVVEQEGLLPGVDDNNSAWRRSALLSAPCASAACAAWAAVHAAHAGACGAAPTRMPCSRSACGTSGSMILSLRGSKHVSCMPAACAMQEFNKDTVWGGEAHQVSATFTPMTLLRLSFLPCAATLQAMQAMQLSQDMDSSRYKRRQASCAQCELRTRLHPGLSSCPAALCCRTSWQLCRKSCGGVTRGCWRTSCAHRSMLRQHISFKACRLAGSALSLVLWQRARCCACQTQAVVQASQAAAGRRLCCA